MTTCFKMVEVRGGQVLAATRNCSGKVVYVDHLGRGWCKRHEPDSERKKAWAEIARAQSEGK